MSFLGNIVKSIGTDQGPPPKPPSRPSSVNANNATTQTPKPGARPPLTHPTSSLTGLKRKADDGGTGENGKASKPNAAASAGNEKRKGPTPPLNGPNRSSDTAPVMPKLEAIKSSDSFQSAKANTSPAPGAVKPTPSKGSYADLMARARESAEQRAQAPVGAIKHQDTAKKMSKLAERRKEEQDKVKAHKTGNGKHVKEDPRRSASPQKKEAKESKESKPSKAPPKGGYKGTMGNSTSRKGLYKGSPKKARYDEYLGTDEEDNSDLEEEDQGGYDSEGSSDMEAGFEDEEREAQASLRHAKQDDAKELALENQLRREKDERRRKLTQMANKRK